MPHVGVCLSGCGVYDGSEIQEAVFTLLALDQAGARIICCAPNRPQAAVIDHLTHKPVPSASRNILAESARIARGHIVDLATLHAADLDALIFPGGYGAAANLCTFASAGADCTVDPQVERLVGEMFAAHKPIGAICIAPALLARILGGRAAGLQLTIGTDAQTAAGISATGAHHVECPCDKIVIDEQNRVVSTPAYMLGSGPAEVFEGIRKLVAQVLTFAQAR